MVAFETVMILDTNMSTKETKEKIKKYADMLQDWCKTKKVNVKDIGLKKLAYEIKKHNEGYYVLFTFMSNPAHISELERRLRIDDQVLKFMTLKLDEEPDFEDYNPDKNPKSEQMQVTEKPDALDVLLGFADYDTPLTNDEKYDIISLRNEERRKS